MLQVSATLVTRRFFCLTNFLWVADIQISIHFLSKQSLFISIIIILQQLIIMIALLLPFIIRMTQQQPLVLALPTM